MRTQQNSEPDACGSPDSPSEASADRSPHRVWRAGTLAYTAGGLTGLFFCLLLGDFAWSMRDRSVGPMAQWYLNHLGVSNLIFALLLTSFPALLAVVIGPIVSVKSDRLRGKRGRRIPFLLVTAPISGLAMIGLAATPLVARWVHGQFPGRSQTVIAAACFAVFWAAYEFATIVAQSVFGGLINDVVPKALLGRFFGFFRAVSLIDGMIFNYWIIGKVPRHFTLILGAIGTFYGFAFMLVCFRVKEGSYPPPPADIDHGSSGALGEGYIRGTKRYVRECFTHSYYLATFALLTLAGFAFTPLNIFSIPYARSLGMDMDVYGKFLALTYFISFVLSYFLGWLADALHPLRLVLAILAAYFFVTLLGGIFAGTPSGFLTFWVLHGVLAGSYYTGVSSLGQRLFPQAKYAQFASAAGLCVAFFNMTLVPATGLIIDGSGGMYRYTFVIGTIFVVLALASGCYVYSRFIKLGGNEDYVAP